MRVRMKSIYAGPAGNYQPGDVADFPSREAKALVEGGFAVDLGKVERRAAAAAPASSTPEGGEQATKTATETATTGSAEQATLTAPETAAQ